MHRYGIEEETWFEAARSGLDRLGFTLRLQPRSIVIDKTGRLPRIIGCAREFLEFAERQGLKVPPDAYLAADHYGDSRSALGGRASESPFETPVGAVAGSAGLPAGWRTPSHGHADGTAPRRPDDSATLAAGERAAAGRGAGPDDGRRGLEARCAALERELARISGAAAEAATQRDLYRMSAAAAEQRLLALQAEVDAAAAAGGSDRRFEQLRRFLARELHPDLAGENASERAWREAIFKRVWAKIEHLQ